MANSPAFGTVSIYRDNPGALGPPSANNDATQGFIPGSRWYDATGAVLYICSDNAAGSAVWQRMLGGGISHVGTVAGGATTVAGGSAVTADGGALFLTGGAGSVGGALSLGGGIGSGGTHGRTYLVNLPTSNPEIDRAIYGPAGAGALSISGGVGPYVASAVHFGGATALGFDAPMTGVVNGKKFLSSIWLANGVNGSAVWDVTPNANFSANITVADFVTTLTGVGYDALGGHVFDLVADQNVTGPAWINIVWSMDAANVGDPGGAQCYVNGALSTAAQSVIQSADIDYAGTFIFGADGFGTFGTFDVADVQIWFGIAPDLSNPSNLAAFIASGKPVNPSVAAALFGSPAVKFSGDASAFAINGGTAGTTSITGDPLTNASSSPSD